MRRVVLIVCIALCALCFSSCRKAVMESNEGITIKTSNGLVRLQFISDKIIRVSATVEDRFSTDTSLIVLPEKSNIEHSITRIISDNKVVISTTSLKVEVSRESGEVIFKDLQGNIILQEQKGGGRSFSPIEVEENKGYSIRQLWETSEDEAFYGLGQHQSDEFNYKGKNEDLYQYNTKVSVPFVVSTRNYGILWDNYSQSRFGDQREYAQLNEVFSLYGTDGSSGGLTSVWTPAPYLSSNPLVRTEPFIYFENLKANKELLPKDFPLNDSNVLFEGEIEPSESGLFRFMLYYAGYISVFLDNQLIVPERWRTAWNPNTYKFNANLKAGVKTPLKILWRPDGGESYCSLRVLSPVPEKEQNKLSFWSEMGNEIDYYFVAGDNTDEVISGYRTLTGKAQIMPRWAMGFWQSKERYGSQQELLGVAKELRKRGMPVDNIVLDWFYWRENEWGSHDFDPLRFPDPKGMVDSLHQDNMHFMISVWPKFYQTTDHYREFDSKGWMYLQAVKDSIRDWVGPGYIGSFYDAYSPGARELFWNQLSEHLLPFGVDAWWMDASEPNIRDCTDMEYRKSLCGPTALGPSTKYFNAYALMNAEAIYDGQRGVDPDKRVFLLTRSGFAGLQRYSTATWSGDIATRWEDMKAQISAGINFSTSGIPYWTMDNGGFCVERRYENGYREYLASGKENSDLKEWRELNARWHQFGAFIPLYRTHGQFPPREIYNIAPEGHPAYRTILDYTKIRYRLIPYIYSLAGMTWFDDYTIMRGLFMDFPTDKSVRDISDQYMFGPSLMVCPVYRYGARSRTVYFPECEGWYDLLSGRFYNGGNSQEVDAPYDKIPVFVLAGAIIPAGEDIQYTGEKANGQVDIFIYAGKDGSFTLYEDEGDNYNYEKGLYSMIEFSYNDQKGEITIGTRKGEFEGMPIERNFNLVLVSKDNPAKFEHFTKGIFVKYQGEEITIKLSAI